ncbi:DUF3427 domain-containing protein [Streptomyces oryzae]|uniref:DUF3427 domain-containing protein n=1 Tax=Streptomyces oryzae TaxID=1434886 RepID=A0ABS3X9W1_9ACTN|nr:DUF3427 domain-containing protein [Streptomyces oryzae]MBO8192168.1 DUF3427 domain-containing protein [Streptomyces oryzae]
MSDSHSQDQPIAGLYEQLITEQLEARLENLRDKGWAAEVAPVTSGTAPRILARHIADTIEKKFAELSSLERVLYSNLLLKRLNDDAPPEGLLTEAHPRQLLALSAEPDGFPIPRPSTPMAEATLITNRQDAMTLGEELRNEILSADAIDLLCSFIKWPGVFHIRPALRAAKERGIPLRILTTTYMGATDPKAIDRLVRDFGAEVRINYESSGSHVHAKAWLFHRKTGFHTAYIGSSNLSKSALSTGLEWNVRVSPASAPGVLDTFRDTFAEYWESGTFETYDPDTDGDRLSAAIQKRKWIPIGKTQTPSESMAPLPHQMDMLERLKAEREVHKKTGALLVAPTGTGKTVMAALDYKSLCKKKEEKPRLLFVAHTKEILEQSLATYRKILGDSTFGELHVDGHKAVEREHVFASIQSFSNARFLESFEPAYFDVLVIDEFHHSAANTYKKVIERFHSEERILLGLTATPERHDGENVHDLYFKGRIAAEMRLWEALDSNLLSPFHYYGIADDSAQFEHLRWRGSGYDSKELTQVLLATDEHARLVYTEVYDKLVDPTSMRALGFCVSVEHARFMADYFQQQGLNAKALDGSTPSAERESAFAGLRNGTIQALFAVNLFNEGLDIPDVDTLLFLRPTESVTVYLQQFGRGLRRQPQKEFLTVLDFVGHHGRNYDFEARLAAVTGLRKGRLIKGIENDSYGLPDGCEIILDRKSKDLIISNIKARLNFPQIVKEVKKDQPESIAQYLESSMRDIADIYRNGNSWTKARRDAKLLTEPAPEGEEKLLRRMAKLLHVDDPERADAYHSLLSLDAPRYDELSATQQLYARMLILNLWDAGSRDSGFSSYQEALDHLAGQPFVRAEAREILEYGKRRIEHSPICLDPPRDQLPLRVHSTYTRAEVLTAIGQTAFTGPWPSQSQSGVEWCQEANVDILFVTLVKKEKDFTEDTRYNDYAIDARLFHWESQKDTAPHTKSGIRYQTHKESGSDVFLFVRKYINNEVGAAPFTFLGPAEYVSHAGEKPMQINWKLQHDVPGEILSYSPTHT